MGLRTYGDVIDGGRAPDGRMGHEVAETVRERIRSAAILQRRAARGGDLLTAALAGLDDLDRGLLEARRLAEPACDPGCGRARREAIRRRLEPVLSGIRTRLLSADHAGVRALAGAPVEATPDGGWRPAAPPPPAVAVDHPGAAVAALEGIDRLRAHLEQERAGLEAVARALGRAADRVSVASQNLRASGPGLRDADLAADLLELVGVWNGGRTDRARSSDTNAMPARTADATRQ